MNGELAEEYEQPKLTGKTSQSPNAEETQSNSTKSKPLFTRLPINSIVK